jgi:hypothetical protein
MFGHHVLYLLVKGQQQQAYTVVTVISNCARLTTAQTGHQLCPQLVLTSAKLKQHQWTLLLAPSATATVQQLMLEHAKMSTTVKHGQEAHGQPWQHPQVTQETTVQISAKTKY